MKQTVLKTIKNNLGGSLLAITGGAALLIACSGAGPTSFASAAENTESELQLVRTISVNGQGSVNAAPDMATITFAVEKRAKGASEAMSLHNQAMQKVMDAMKKQGIVEKDMMTSGFNLNADYDYNNITRKQNLIGHIAYSSLTIKVRDIDEAGSIIDAGILAGANRMNGIYFGFADDAELMDKARKNAVANAKAKAALYAAESGVKLGKVISISEGGSAQPYPQPMMGRAKFAEADMAAAPIATGESSVSVNVSIVYSID